MNVLAFGDLHGKLPRNLGSIIKKNKIKLIITVGEMPNVPFPEKKGETKRQYRSRFVKHYKNILKRLNSFSLPVFVLRGNETASEARNLIRSFKNIAYKRIGKEEIDGNDFIFFDTIWEKWAYQHISKSFLNRKSKNNLPIERKLNKLLRNNPDCILISHAPPYGYLDKINSGKHVGSKILLKAIRKNKPKLVLCGHIHEAKGKTRIGKTIVYNLGSHGSYKILKL